MAATQREVAIEEAKKVGIGKVVNVEAMRATPKELKVMEVLEDTNAH